MDALEAQILNASSGLSVELPTSLTGFRSRPRPRRPLAERLPEEDVGISGASQIDERPREVEDPNKSYNHKKSFDENLIFKRGRLSKLWYAASSFCRYR